MFDNLSSLQGLFLTGNSELTSVAANSLTSSGESLQRLLLDNCSLTWLPAEFLEQFTNDDFYVWLAGNQWDCSCELQVKEKLLFDIRIRFDVNRASKRPLVI